MRHCEICERYYDETKKKNGGYIHHCDKCSGTDVERFVGRTNEKNEGTTVFKTNLSYWKALMKRENSAGFGPNLPVSSPAFEQNKGEKGDK